MVQKLINNTLGHAIGDQLLQSEKIPLQSRIISIVDAYDAMISHRPYRKSLTKLEAIEELHRHAGSQFDPALVRVFLDALKGEAGSPLEMKVG